MPGGNEVKAVVVVREGWALLCIALQWPLSMLKQDM